jgi:hypothetical protein
MIGIGISPTACRVMAERLRDVCTAGKRILLRAGRGFVVRDLPIPKGLNHPARR